MEPLHGPWVGFLKHPIAEIEMRDQNRDPYAAPPAPRERRVPMLRFAIVAVLLAAGVWAYVTYSQGPDQNEAAQQAASAVADASRTRGYAASPPEFPEAAPPPEAEAPAAPRSGAATPPAAAPAPATATVPPA